MWMLITVISMLTSAMTEIVGKRSVSTQEHSIFKLRISIILVDAAALVFLWLFYYRGTGVTPVQIVLENPLIIVSTSLTILDTFLYLIALRYIGLTIQEAYYGASSIMVFLGMLLLNFFSGELGDIRKMLIPGKLLVIVLMIGASFVLPRLDWDKESERAAQKEKTSRRNLLIGLLFTLFALLFDSAEMILTAAIFDEAKVQTLDYIAAGTLVALPWGAAFYVCLCCKTKKLFNPFQKGNRIYIIYGLLNLTYLFFYLYGTFLAPVQSSLFWAVYPIVPVIGSAVILKERYTVKQNICIGIIIASSIAFGIMDLLL